MNKGSRCPLCGGVKKIGSTTYSVDMGFGVVVVRNVPATICELCGEEWIAPRTAKKLEEYVASARRGGFQIEVLSYGKAA